MDRMLIGNSEFCCLPDLGITKLPIRVDTGAHTSSLHVDNLRTIQIDGEPHVSFDLHPDMYDLAHIVHCTAPLHDSRAIKSSNGQVQKRSVIQTTLRLGGQEWPIQLTLTNRKSMTYMMLFGREGMGNRVYVDPSAEYLLGQPNA